MQRLKSILRALAASINDRIPQRLPSTPQAFERWSEAILVRAGLPVNDSTRQALAAMIQNIVGAEELKVAPRRFIIALKRAVLNQNAFTILQDIRERAKEAREAELKKAAEALVQQTEG